MFLVRKLVMAGFPGKTIAIWLNDTMQLLTRDVIGCMSSKILEQVSKAAPYKGKPPTMKQKDPRHSRLIQQGCKPARSQRKGEKYLHVR
jgi:hypothetical protein